MTAVSRARPATTGWRSHAGRVPVFAFALSIAIHAAMYWLMPQLTSAWRALPDSVLSAILLPEPIADRAPPAPPAKTRRAARLTGKTVELPREPAPAAESAPADTAPAAQSAGDETGSTASVLAEERPSITTPAEVARSEAPIKAEVVAPAASPVPSQAVELPSRISLSFKVISSISDGVADYTWKRDGNRYQTESSLQATGFFVNMFAGVMHQVSQGEVDTTGLKPDLFRFRRGEGEADVAEFLRPANELRLIRGGRARTQPLPPNIQDTQSFLFQFAYEADRLQSPDDRLDVLVTNARKVYRHRFRVVGKETVETQFGTVSTLHLRSEAVDPEDVYEVWLSPENHHLPVKLKFFAGRFPIELIATSIRSTP